MRKGCLDVGADGWLVGVPVDVVVEGGGACGGRVEATGTGQGTVHMATLRGVPVRGREVLGEGGREGGPCADMCV